MTRSDQAQDPRWLAVFDLDGTITRRDTFLPFLWGWQRRNRRRSWLRGLALSFWHYLAGERDRGRLKSELIRRLMSGATRTEVEAWSRQFVEGLDDRMLCAGALAAIDRHRRAGDRLVLLSASVDLYVPLIGMRLGFDETICTGVAWHHDRLEGSLTTANRRAGEKLRCIEALRRRHQGLAITAYANSSSDLVHLRAVERPVLVNARPKTRRAARRFGIPTADWCNKWQFRPVQSS